MKTILTLSLCALFALGTAEAKTFYVDASRPNNKGNGRSLKTAKKTIQAAVNIAKNGDTIIVYPGTYSKINTKNKKIHIKANKGVSNTTIASSSNDYGNSVVAKLGAEWSHTETVTYAGSGGGAPYTYSWKVKSGPETKGSNTKMSGFTISGAEGSPEIGVSGGTLVSCLLTGHKSNRTTYRTTLTECTIQDNGDGSSYSDNGYSFSRSTLTRCKILNNDISDYQPSMPSEESKFYNCLFAGNRKVDLKSCTLVNCTVADNTGRPAQSNKVQPGFRMTKTKAYNTIFNGVSSAQFKKSKKNTLKNCYKGKAPKFVKKGELTTKVWWQRIDGGTVVWNLYDEYFSWVDGSTVSAKGTTESAILASAKAKVGYPDAEYYITELNYTYGTVYAAGTTESAILANAKAKSKLANAEYSFNEEDYLAVFNLGDYRLTKGSPCVNKGKLTAAQKKAVGKKDLAGKKRIRGKIDIGCYEL